MRGSLRRITLLLGLVVLAAVAVPAALANPPTITRFPDFTLTGTITDVCAFSIDVTSSITKPTETDFTDHSGVLTEIDRKFFEQDTFVGPSGKTLVGDIYSAELRLLFDSNGNLTHIYGDGPIEKVSLPDGSTFFSAGRVDVLAQGVSFTLTPDTGHSGNVAGFCAALAP